MTARAVKRWSVGLAIAAVSSLGALALQCRRNDSQTRELLEALDDSESEACVTAALAYASSSPSSS